MRTLVTCAVCLVFGACAGDPIAAGSPVGTADPVATQSWTDPGSLVGGARVDVGTADVAFRTTTTGRLGVALAMPGDLNGDGMHEVALGDTEVLSETRCDPDPEAVVACIGLQTSNVGVVYGTAEAAGARLGQRLATITGWDTNDVPDLHIAGAGDVDGDGYDDMLIGLSLSGCTSPTSAFLMYGGPEQLEGGVDAHVLGAVITDEEYCSGFGRVAGLGDLDGDGFDDFGVAADGARRGLTGHLYVFYGSPERLSGRLVARSSATAVLRTSSLDHDFGRASAAGDLDGDGFDDYLVEAGRTRNTVEPRTYLVRGGPGRPSGPTSVERIAAAEIPGQALRFAQLGDLDGDGLDDLAAILVEDPNAYVVYGRATWPERFTIPELAALTIPPLDATDVDAERGRVPRWLVVEGGGDINGDGHRDLLLGDSGYRQGGATVIFGRPGRRQGSLDADTEGLVILGREGLDPLDPGASEGAGQELIGDHDVNGDGLSDFLVAAPGRVSGAPTSDGAVYLFLGRRN